MAAAAAGAQMMQELENRTGNMVGAYAEMQNSSIRQNMYRVNADNMANATRAEADTNAFSADTANLTSQVQSGATPYAGVGFNEQVQQAIGNITAGRDANIHNLQERGNIALGNALTVNAANMSAADAKISNNTNQTKILSSGLGLLGVGLAALNLTKQGKDVTFEKSKNPQLPGTIYANQVNFNNGFINGRSANAGSQGGQAYLQRSINNANNVFDSSFTDIASEAHSADVAGHVEGADQYAELVDNWNQFGNMFHPQTITGSEFSTGKDAYMEPNGYSYTPQGRDQRASLMTPSDLSSIPSQANSMMGRPSWFNVSPDNSVFGRRVRDADNWDGITSTSRSTYDSNHTGSTYTPPQSQRPASDVLSVSNQSMSDNSYNVDNQMSDSGVSIRNAPIASSESISETSSDWSFPDASPVE